MVFSNIDIRKKSLALWMLRIYLTIIIIKDVVQMYTHQESEKQELP